MTDIFVLIFREAAWPLAALMFFGWMNARFCRLNAELRQDMDRLTEMIRQTDPRAVEPVPFVICDDVENGDDERMPLPVAKIVRR